MTAHLTRRQALAGLAAMAALAGCRNAAATPVPDDTATLDLAAVEDRHRARIGMYAVDLNSAARLQHRPDDRFAMCSTFKTYAAARVLQLTAHGQLRLDTSVPIHASDIVENSPVTSANVGGSMTLEQICAAALEKSDNTAGNLLLQRIGGPPAISTFARTVGDDQSRLDRWETELNTALPGDVRDTTTPRALAWGYREVLVGAALTNELRERLLSWMREPTPPRRSAFEPDCLRAGRARTKPGRETSAPPMTPDSSSGPPVNESSWSSSRAPATMCPTPHLSTMRSPTRYG